MRYRFRVSEAGNLVLQVYEYPKQNPYTYGDEGKWRDAKVEDIPVTNPFDPRTPEAPVWNGKT